MKPNKPLLFFGCAVFLVSHLSLYAHPGGLDASGCHHNRKTGDYHCHQPSSPSPSTLSSKPTEASLAYTGSSISQPAERFVMRAVDGDTIELSDGEKVRLIGVDTPETVHPNRPVEAFGKEASAFTKREIEGQSVRLEFDQGNAHLNHKDKYGRTLAYVYRMKDGFFLNAEIIKQGYGHAYTRFPFKYLEEFRQYEHEARENKRGLWA